MSAIVFCFIPREGEGFLVLIGSSGTLFVVIDSAARPGNILPASRGGEIHLPIFGGIFWTAPQGWTSCCLEKKWYRIDSSLDIPFRCNYSNNVMFYGAIHFEES